MYENIQATEQIITIQPFQGNHLFLRMTPKSATVAYFLGSTINIQKDKDVPKSLLEVV